MINLSALQRPEALAALAVDDAFDSASGEAPVFTDVDLIVPAIDPGRSTTAEEQEIVVPVLGPAAMSTPLAISPRTGARLSPQLPVRARAGAVRAGDTADDEVNPPPRRRAGAGKGRLPPPPRGSDPDDSGNADPLPILRPTPRVASSGRRAGIEVVLFILVIAGAIILGLFYVDPQLRQQATAWLTQWSWMRGSSQDDASGTPDARRRPGLAPMSAVPPSGTEVPNESSGVSTAPALPGTSSQPAFPEPAQVHAAPDQSANSDQAAAQVPSADDAAYNRARALYGAALDADAAHDYKKAVELFEQIKKLPRQTWHADLELKLKLARASAASEK